MSLQNDKPPLPAGGLGYRWMSLGPAGYQVAQSTTRNRRGKSFGHIKGAKKSFLFRSRTKRKQPAAFAAGCRFRALSIY